MKIKESIPLNRIPEVIEYSFNFFKDIMSKQGFEYYLTDLANVNWNKSVLITDDDDKIYGVYLLGNHQLTHYDKSYDNLNGIEGVLLCVDLSIRNQGWGEKLKDYPKTLGFDYIWGQQFKSLNNLEHWLKRRKLVATTSDCYITVEIYDK